MNRIYLSKSQMLFILLSCPILYDDDTYKKRTKLGKEIYLDSGKFI